MRVFNQLVFDDTVITNTALTDPSFNALLGAADQLKLVAVADPVPSVCALSVQVEESGDNRNFVSKNGTAEISAASLSTSSVTTVSGSEPGTAPSSGYVRLKISLSSAGVPVRLRIYATGRGQFPL